jgi:hypothetical protein
MLESKFKSDLISELKALFPGCIITGLDANAQQGLPDLLILFENNWAALEIKRSAKASRRPNQEYYVDLMNKMSYSAFVCPENKEEVLDALQEAFFLRR